MRNRVWDELTQTKHSAVYTALFIERSKKLLRYFNIGILVFSTSGIAGWKLWEDYPIYACLAVSIASLVKLLVPHLIIDEKQLLQWNKINDFYCQYFNKLEKLWQDLQYERIESKELTEAFYSLKDTENEINQRLNELDIKKPKSLVKKTEKISIDYFYRVYNVKP